ncbi:hypothetical protein ABZ502_17785 [Streptomyces abikoensis]|uniref:hypothetical protein n=1 Tax=Streptomyces abikoensis TaxID=97398 RepID=UPI0033F4A6E0
MTTLDAWQAFLRRPGVTIRNEYGRSVSDEEMLETMTETHSSDGLLLQARFRRNSDDRYVTSGGHAFCHQEFC